ncbi:MAG TPA: endonuclease/exonuclease/phosphatase family protein [Thermoleophilaceae bacterium]|nr:endonuclease/exonuclease/phosphatase family protein [Thermoleophilaceae bacterium]
MRVLVWNLFHGRAVPGAGRALLDEFAARIAGWEWDVALLQEVPPWWPPELARAAGAEERTALTSRNELLPLRRAVAVRRPDLIRSNGGGSNALLVRGGSIAEHRAVRLRRFPERRVLQLARLGDGTHLANMHLSLSRARARDELERALALAGDGSPLIFGGDLNLRDPVAPGLEHVAARDVDHVFVRGCALAGEVVRLDRGLESGGALSDHEALLVPLAPRSPRSAP